MAGEINSNICVMLSFYKSYHQTDKYGWKRNHILQDLTGLEIQISSKTENQFETSFQQPKSSSQKTGINIPNGNKVLSNLYGIWSITSNRRYAHMLRFHEKFSRCTTTG